MDKTNEQFNSGAVDTGSKQNSTVSAAATEVSRNEMERHNLEFQCRYNIFLTDDYADHYGRLELACSFVGIVFGFTAMTSIAESVGQLTYGLMGFASSVLALLSVVYGFGRRSSNELRMKAAFESALNDLTKEGACDHLESIRASIAAISDDPKRNEISRAIAYNEAVDEMGLDESYKLDVGWISYHTRFWLPWRKPNKG